MILEISQIIHMQTPNGRGIAKFLIDPGCEADLQWVVFQDTGEIWCWQNRDVRLLPNITMGRKPNDG